MRRFVVAVSAVAVGLLAIQHAESLAGSAASVTIHVSSAQADKPVEFAVRYFGAGPKSGEAKDRVSTPFDITVPGEEAYAIFRQTGGAGVMRLEVRKGIALSGTTAGPIGMVIVTREGLAVTGFEQ